MKDGVIPLSFNSGIAHPGANRDDREIQKPKDWEFVASRERARKAHNAESETEKDR